MRVSFSSENSKKQEEEELTVLHYTGDAVHVIALKKPLNSGPYKHKTFCLTAMFTYCDSLGLI